MAPSFFPFSSLSAMGLAIQGGPTPPVCFLSPPLRKLVTLKKFYHFCARPAAFVASMVHPPTAKKQASLENHRIARRMGR